MFKIRRSILFVALVTLPLIVGCSSTPPTSEDGSETASAESTSSSDEVGSTPEDTLLADEAKPTEETAATTEAEQPAADPFKDLQATAAPSDGASNLSTIESGSGGGEQKSYTVKSGDTLMKIAFTIYGDVDRWKDIQSWNAAKIKHANKLSAGMSLSYEAPSAPFNVQELGHTYLIKKGDTLAIIADEVYGRKMKFKKLQKFNSHLVKNPNKIFAGFTLYYDITEQEVAEAEARRQQRLAGNAPAPAPEAPPPTPASEAPPSVITGTNVAPAEVPPVATNQAPAAQPAPAATTAQ
jgi:nucleoid-associated protein YgaU